MFRSANLIGCVAILLIWTKLFYWMRLFESFAAFIRMIQEMIVSSGVFFFMLLLLWVAFANVFVLIEKNRAYVIDPKTGEPFEAIFSEQSGVGLIDATIYTYLVGLGDFDTDNFNQSDIGMNWVIFILSTYIIQLVFMNVLIALMSDAYASVKEIQDQSVLKEQVSLMENYSFLISKEKLFNDGDKYLLYIVSEQVEEDIPQTEKNFAKLREVLSYKTETSEGRLLAKIGQNEEHIRSEISIVKTNMTAMKEDILKQIQNVLNQGRGKGVPAFK